MNPLDWSVAAPIRASSGVSQSVNAEPAWPSTSADEKSPRHLSTMRTTTYSSGSADIGSESVWWTLCICRPCKSTRFLATYYLALAGGTMPFMRRYSTIWP